MHELFQFYPQLAQWHTQQKGIAIATVIRTWGSSPRRVGAIMAITDSLEMIGSVSAGCIESAVIEEAQAVINLHRPKTLHYGITDELALDVGLACGGEISIYVQPYPLALHEKIEQYLEIKEAFFWQSIETADNFTQNLLVHHGQISTISLQQSTDSLTLTQKISLPLTLMIVGGNHIAVALAKLAKITGYCIILIDPRTAFANHERFPDVDKIISQYPHKAFQEVALNSSTALVILAHDPKIDDSALELGLQSSAFYIGALGGRKTQMTRRERLQKVGITPQQLARLHAPIGLDIGAETPEQIALSILSEIIACQNK